jgi:hypothetical protein
VRRWGKSCRYDRTIGGVPTSYHGHERLDGSYVPLWLELGPFRYVGDGASRPMELAPIELVPYELTLSRL